MLFPVARAIGPMQKPSSASAEPRATLFHMQPHQERVLVEEEDLAEKVAKLDTFLSGTTVTSIAAEEQVRLIIQYKFMKLYLEVLRERIASF